MIINLDLHDEILKNTWSKWEINFKRNRILFIKKKNDTNCFICNIYIYIYIYNFNYFYLFFYIFLFIIKKKTFFYYPIILPNELTVIFATKCISLIGKSQTFFCFFFGEKSSWTWYRTKFFFLIVKMKSWKEFGEVQETKSTFGKQLIYLIFTKMFHF